METEKVTIGNTIFDIALHPDFPKSMIGFVTRESVAIVNVNTGEKIIMSGKEYKAYIEKERQILIQAIGDLMGWGG